MYLHTCVYWFESFSFFERHCWKWSTNHCPAGSTEMQRNLFEMNSSKEKVQAGFNLLVLSREWMGMGVAGIIIDS